LQLPRCVRASKLARAVHVNERQRAWPPGRAAEFERVIRTVRQNYNPWGNCDDGARFTCCAIQKR